MAPLIRLFMAALLLSASIAQAGDAGKVQFVVGDVSVETPGSAPRALKKGDGIAEGDTVVTGAGGQAQLLMSDEAIVAVRPDTRLEFTNYSHSGRPDGKEQGLMSLVRGGFRNITGWIGRSRPAAYRIKTPTATIGIRGTDHEPLYIPPPEPGATPIGPPGTYNKVNSGSTFIENASGRIEVGPNQVGFAPPTPGVAPSRLPQIPAFMRAAAPARGDGDKRGNREADQRGGEKRDGQGERRGEGQGQKAPEPTAGAAAAKPAPTGTPAGGATPAGLMPPGGMPAGTGTGPMPAPGMQGPAPGMMPGTGTMPLPGAVAPPLPPPIKGTLDLTNPPAALVVAPNGYVMTGGDLSGSSVGNGAGVVGNDFGVVLDAAGNVLNVGGGGFSYARNGASQVQQGSAVVGGVPVRWGIYAGGQINDTQGLRNPAFFHFMGAPNATSKSVLTTTLTASGPMTFTAVAANNEYTKPIAENGAVGGSVGLSITLNNVSSTPSVTAYNLNVTDANARSWTGSLAGPAVPLGTFLTGGGAMLNVGCTGCSVATGSGSAHGAAIGTTTIQGVVSSYDLKAGAAGVTGSVLAR